MLLFLFIAFLPVRVDAQIMNMESKRLRTDTTGFAGSAGTRLSIQQNPKRILTFAGDAQVQYKTLRHLILLFLNAEFARASGEDFVNEGVGHIRYNYKILPEVWMEAFSQVQYDPVSRLDLRVVSGTGPRFKAVGLPAFRLYLGTAYMFEFEQIDEQVNDHRHHRSSSYLSSSLELDRVRLSNTTYFQFRLDDAGDHRVVSNTSLTIWLTDVVAFETVADITYDSRPNEDVPELRYKLQNGFRFRF